SLQIKQLIKNSDTNQQKLGYNVLNDATYISETTKRDMAREVIEWLRSLTPQNSKQDYAIKSILINWNVLQKTPQRDFNDFIFDKLIGRGESIDKIQFGFEVLNQLNPRYEDYSTYFDDVLSKIEIESDPNIKSELLSGLLDLKPTRTNKRNKDFWGKIENLSL
ncbi:MAG: hypothetical protein KAW56_00360, partial [Candidatus Marinimicrobia bacterium]|nr:hypothetical protein [Candidatus Neomarinimicrobiota bacterium]